MPKITQFPLLSEDFLLHYMIVNWKPLDLKVQYGDVTPGFRKLCYTFFTIFRHVTDQMIDCNNLLLIWFSTHFSFLSREPVDEVLQMPPSLLTCGGCQQSIGDRFFLKAIEQYWHEDCLSCDLCGCRLGEVGRRLYYKLGRKLCRRDYLRLV